MNIVNQSVTVQHPTESEGLQMAKRMEYGGRTCYASHDKMSDTSYVRFLTSLIERGHLTPQEFGEITFELVTSRDVMAEITRHRIANFAIESQRYVLYGSKKEIGFIKPLFFTTDPEDIKSQIWRDACDTSEHDYKQMTLHGAKPQDARKVLNNSVATKIIMKMNVREARHFFSLRCDQAAYPETRHLACMMLREAQKAIPVVFDDLAEKFLHKKEHEHDHS